MKNRRAILMAEVGLGAMFMGMMMVGAMSVLKTGVTGTAQSMHLTQALHAARSAINAAETLGYDELTDASLQALVARVEVPPGLARPKADPLDTVKHTYPDKSWYRAKVITVRVGWVRMEGKQERGEVVLHGLTILSH